MATYRVFHTPLFDEQFDALVLVDQKRVDKIEAQLAEKGPLVGKPLGFIFFREKKLDGKRLYFLVYEEWSALLLVALDDKKTQPETIAHIRENISRYKEFVWSRLCEDNSI